MLGTRRLLRTGMWLGVLVFSVAAVAGAARPAAPRGTRATARTRTRSAQVSRGRLVIPKGTKVTVVFDQALSSKTTAIGQRVRLHVADDVRVGGQKVIDRGARVQGVISKVLKRKRYGRNAEMRIVLRPVASVTGKKVPLEAGGKGEEVSGRKSAQAAGATVGGAVAIGPVGLIGGYFIHGKPVTIKEGDTLVTEVPKEVVLRRR
jgi:hypothetical protein